MADTAKATLSQNKTLREEVRDALRAVLSDPASSAAAKASAGRTLLEYYDEGGKPGSGRRSTEMTAEELDQEIARLTPNEK